MNERMNGEQTAAEAEAKLKAHLAKRGYGDIEVKVTGVDRGLQGRRLAGQFVAAPGGLMARLHLYGAARRPAGRPFRHRSWQPKHLYALAAV